MSQQTKDEVMTKLRGRYTRAGQQHKSKLIDQAIDLFDYHRSQGGDPCVGAPAVSAARPGVGRPSAEV